MGKTIYRLAGILLLLAMSACAAVSAIPEGYSGPIAHIADSVKRIDPSSAEFYYVESVNGLRIQESHQATRDASYEQGAAMTTRPIERDVPAVDSTFVIVGRNDYAAPIQALTHKIYQVRGETKFTPAPGGSYVVKGVLGADYSAVWIEDTASGDLVGQKVEVKGSAELGFFEK